MDEEELSYNESFRANEIAEESLLFFLFCVFQNFAEPKGYVQNICYLNQN